MERLDAEWHQLQRTTDQNDTALQAQIEKVERLRAELMTEIRRLEKMLGLHGR
jgi:hypothetical protein